MTEKVTNIGGRLHDTSSKHTVTGANEILDDDLQKKQSVINAEQQEFNQEQEGINADIYRKNEVYNKEETNNLISRTPETDVIVVDIPAEIKEEIDPSSTLDSKFFIPSGEIRSSNACKIKVYDAEPLKKYWFTGAFTATLDIPFVAWFDENEQLILCEAYTGSESEAVSYNDQEITAPANARYLYLNTQPYTGTGSVATYVPSSEYYDDIPSALSYLFPDESSRPNKLYRVPGPTNTTFSEWAWDGENWVMLANKDYGIDDEPLSDSDNCVKSSGIFKAIKESQRGFVVDYNHVWNYYNIDDARNQYEYADTFDTVLVALPKNAFRVHVEGIQDAWLFYFSSFNELSNDTIVYHRLSDETRGVIITPVNGADLIPEYIGEASPILLVINVRKSSQSVNFSYDDLHIWFDYTEDAVNCELSLNSKKISILGDSMSSYATYTYWMNGGTKEFSNRYPAYATYAINNIRSIHQMWWKRIFDKCGAVLEVGSCIGSSGISDNRYYGQSSYLDRYADLGNPDVIFIEGFHNEPPTAACTFDPSIPIEELDTLDVGQAYDKLIRLLRATYTNARIIDMVINPIPQDKFKNISEEIDSYYNIEHIECLRSAIDYTTITTDNVHPDADCMKRIADYIIENLANNTADVATKEYVIENAVKEVETDVTEPGVVAYISDKTGRVLARIMTNGSIERTAKNHNDIIIDELVTNVGELYGNTLQESYIEISDTSIVGYLADKNKILLAKINKDGSIDRFVDNERDKHTVHFEDISIDEYINLLTDKNSVVIGGIKSDGTVHIFKAEIDNMGYGGGDIAALVNSLPVIAAGLDNITISQDKRIMSLITSVNTDHIIEVQGNDISSKLKPCISIIDDDTLDLQIPSSYNGSTPPNNRGGYFSILLPLMLSLGAKYNKKVPYNMACEGQRVGLTPLSSSSDAYTVLNENGNAVKWMHDNMGWDVINHSMTAQLPKRTYYVDGINSELAGKILANGTYVSYLSFSNTIVLDRLTGKWYEVNSTKTAWVERTPTKKYAQPYYREYINPDDTSENANHNGPWYINRDFDFDYSWGEWFRRAEALGLPFERVIAFNGSTTSPFTISASRKYSYYSIGYDDWFNYPPIKADISRGEVASGDSNVKDIVQENALKARVDKCKAENLWLVFTTHAYDTAFYNFYVDGQIYPDGDPNYPSEWEVPLKYSEIQDIIGENVHDYINHPPSRLNISTWDEWYPAPGTKLASEYDVLDYALSKGVEIVPVSRGWELFGNLLNIGVDRNGKTYSYDSASSQTPYTEEEQSFLTIGADGSIRYFSK